MSKTETEEALETEEAREAAEAPETEAPEAEAEADDDGENAEKKPLDKEQEKKRSLPRISLDGRFTAVLVLFALTAAIVSSAFLWRAWSSASQQLDAQQQVRTRSAEFARAFLLYKNADLDGWEKRLTALAVPDYRNAISQAVKVQFPVIKNLGADSQVTVREVFVNDFSGDVAKTMVVADTQVTSKEFVRTVTGMRLLVELRKQKNGAWLVSAVGALGIDDESMTDRQGNALDPSKVEIPEVAPSASPSAP